MTKRLRLIFAILTAFALLLAALIGFVPQGAAAEADGYSWSVRVTKYVNDTYQDLGAETTLSDALSVTILIKNDGSSSDNFSYYSSLTKIESNVLPQKPAENWTGIDHDSTKVVDGTTYLFNNFTFSGKTQRYFYFRRGYAVDTDNDGIVDDTAYEYYNRSWHVVVNPELSESDLLITGIRATYKATGGDVNEYGGEWIGTDLTFTVTTKYMTERNGGVFDAGSEKLRYSVDQKDPEDRTKTWLPINKNVVSFKDSLKDARVDFELTDIDRNYVKYASYERPVNIDAQPPAFAVRATAQDIEGYDISYSNNTWSANDIVFFLSDRSGCISDVTYSVSTDGATFTDMGSAYYRVSATVRGLIFRATNRAGVTYTHSDSFSALIDRVRPGVAVEAFTPDPEDETNNVAITTGYANGTVSLNVYNRNIAGEPIVNASDVRCYYSVRVNDGAFSESQEATTVMTDGVEKRFVLNGTIGKNVVMEKREYKFYLVSGSGLTSNETSYTVTLVNGNFDIEVQEITYVSNASGWSAAPIDVFVTVPTDSKIERDYEGNVTGYTVPTAKYTFVYSPINVSGVSYEVPGTYYRHVDGEEGKSVYTFKLDASAESAFTVYAVNAAGKRSLSTYTSKDVIKIDTQPPVVEITGYIKNGDVSGEDSTDPIYIASGTWVNGRVNLTLTVKDGVSGISVRDMHYAVDGAGNPVHDAHGNMVWQESSTTRTWNGQINRSDGSKYFVYNVVAGVPDATVNKMTEEYRFRVYTGSGVYKDVSFVVNIDLNSIILESLSYQFDKVGDTVDVRANEITISPVCADGTITLLSNEEQIGHFDYFLYDETTESYVRVESNEIEVEIPDGRRGTIEKKLYLASRAIDHLGVYYTTDKVYPYVIRIPYNTLNISIERSIIKDGVIGDDEDWVDSDVTVQVTLLANDQGTPTELSTADRSKYTYYYMLIPAAGLTDFNTAIKNGTWVAAENGSYQENNAFEFVVGFSGKSFYGYIALSVTNEAGFRSADGGDMATLLKIDRTTPKISDMIVVTAGTNEDNLTGEYHTVTYYSKDAITLTPKRFDDRATIYYFYAPLEESGVIPTVESTPTITGNPTKDAEGNWTLRGWTRLTADTALTAEDGFSRRYYLLYAVNELGKYAGGLSGEDISYQYEFIVDSSEMSGNLSYRQEDGGYFDSSLNMYAFMWEKQATVTLYATGSNTKVMYWYSLDDGRTWEAYHESDGIAVYHDVGESNAKALRFDENYFPDGVNGAFTFKAVNKAGTEYLYDQKIYIAIDTMTPDFEIRTTVDGVDYHSERLSLVLTDKSAAEWSSKPVTITINMTKLNKSGVRLTYSLEYLVNGIAAPKTEERELPSYTSFTTDRLDGFGKNRDAVITIYATSRADGEKRMSHQVRVKVDQVVPVFTLTGHASDDDSAEPRQIVSGQWTNRRRVTVSKASDPNYVNVSGVSYRYKYTDLDSTGAVENAWPDSNPYFEKICTIEVTATTEAGLTYTQRFDVNIDTIDPVIKFMSNITVVEHEKHYIDLKVYVEEENIDICEYITTIGDMRGFALDPTGYVISTSSVDNTVKLDPATNTEYRGYVKIYVKDYAGNEATFEFYMLPFNLDVNNITLSDADRRTVDKYEEDLNEAESYMEASRVVYFRNLISRLRDRIHTLENEIDTYRAYLARLAQRTSFELRSDYAEMYSYLETYNNYKLYGQAWIQDAIKGDSGSVYYGYFQNLENVFKELQGKMENVTAVEEETRLLPAINMVVADEYTSVLNVYTHYQDLSSDQKACFNSNLYTKLLALKKKCEILLLSDEKTGISLDAEFAPGSRIQVETFSDESEYFTNAQTALMNTVAESDARAVLSIYRIGLRGEASQTSTGEVTVNMPIPEEYQQYIRFAVYKMGVDGTITKVENMEIEGDGKSVTFVADELSTFVLAAKANIQQPEVKTDTFGTFLGLDLDVTMIRTFIIIGAVLVGVLLLIIVFTGLRHRRFLNTYNRAYKSGIYRRGIQRIPKGNTVPRKNPLNPNDRVRDQKKPY